MVFIVSNISFQEIKIKVVFFDPYVVGTLELKDKSTLTADEYIAEWKIKHPTGNRILMFFKKNERTSQTYTFKKLAVTKNLEDEILFPKIVKFIQNNANNGLAIVGVKKVEGGSGHIVIIMPKSLNEGSNPSSLPIGVKTVKYPICLECGTGEKKIEPFRDKSNIINYKWYKYK